jgi:alpha-glucan,water dikinase
VRAFSQDDSPIVTERTKKTGSSVYDHTFKLKGGFSLDVKITEEDDGGTQAAVISTNASGKLLLHWGVEGGRGYKGGWRLPGRSSRPEGTVEYKKRALQTPFTSPQASSSSAEQVITLKFSGDETSDYLNFVIKDTISDRWYDINDVNFQIPLRKGLSVPTAPPPAAAATANGNGNKSTTNNGNGNTNSSSLPTQKEDLLPLNQIPPIPQDLGGVWAYMKWEAAGCPARSKEEADSEYENSLQELITLLRHRISMDQLRTVSNEGIGRYVSFIEEQKAKWHQASSGAAAVSAPKEESVEKKEKDSPEEVAFKKAAASLPDDLVGLKAYLMWEAAGRQDGADFADQAREVLAKQVLSGKSIQEIEEIVRGPQQPQKQEQQHIDQKQSSEIEQQAPQAPQAPPPPQPVVVGESIGMRDRNPLDLINKFTSPTSAPHLAEKAKKRETPLTPLLASAQEDESCVWYRVYALGSKSELLVTVKQTDPAMGEDSPVEVILTTDTASDVVLHWGVKKSGRSGDWKRPSENFLPKGSVLLKDGIAAETEFTRCNDEECYVIIGGSVVPLQRTAVTLPKGHGLSALTFVIRSKDGTRWWNDGGSNFTAPVPGPKPAATEADSPLRFEDEISRIIVDSEVNSGAWTLMHRFNKASELLQGVTTGRFEPAEDAMARIFVWLRYSSIRQLTWQRNYNTQPRILGAAQERLTHAIADAYDRLQGPAQEWARLCLTTVGRGGNAQAVRDEILNIMHRNKISEVKGTWMEEFHQKLHNNTTPDDVPICEAYLAFLRSDGDLNAYLRVLSEAGISRARLESFDRPIKTDPHFFADKKDALIHDFSNYLNILKATHSGADLQASASAASSFIPGSAKGYLGYVLAHTNDPAVLPLMEAAVEARAELSSLLTSNRELIYLDLALENVVRSAAERGAAAAGTAAAAFVTPLLQNLALSIADNEEVCYCLKAWLELPESIRQGRSPSKDDALRTIAVVDRLRRALGQISDYVSAGVGEVSSTYGRAFGCDPWAVELFAEEIVRGGPAFAVSLVLSSVEPGMRSAAELGAWQVISPSSSAQGQLVVVPSLQGIQDKVFEQPTILLATRVTGEEEVPVGVVGVLSGDAPDVLSHLSVRTRNLRILFAACYDEEQLDEVARLEGATVEIGTTAAGGVTWQAVEGGSSSSSLSSVDGNGVSHHKKLVMSVPAWSKQWAVQMDGFKDGVVGAKSKNLAGLRGKLPDWISLPASVTIPFSCFEEALKRKENTEIAEQLADHVKKVTPVTAVETLAKCRELAAQVAVPTEAQQELRTAMSTAGIPVPAIDSQEWTDALGALSSVWLSKYNDRAYISTRKVGINFDDVRMAVLVQSVIPARYAFVIHTENPTTGDKDEIYCEMVRGLGEAIVSGTVPGTSLAFTARKDALNDPQVLLYPSKSEGMFVADGSLIFRSDSNGEDLEGYAGAGLYDSVTTAQTVREVVDYSSDPLISDPEFRRKLMEKICRAGAEIETSLGSAQDVEGVIDHDLNVYVVQTRPQM